MANTWLTYNGSALARNGYGVGITSGPAPVPAGGIRFRFSDPTYDPTQESWGAYQNTWTRVTEMEGNVWDHTGNVLTNKYKSKFKDASNLVEILSTNHVMGESGSTGYWDGIFSDCTALVYADFSNEVRPCTVRNFFYGCTRLREVVFAPMTSFDYTFCGCNSLESVRFASSTAGCTSFKHTFNGCTRLTYVSPYLWTGDATNISGMFSGCSLLENFPDIDCTNCTDASSAFFNCSKLSQLNISNTGRLVNCASMFFNCTSLLVAPDISLLNATSCARMFGSCKAMTIARDYDTDNATDLSHMFEGCSSLRNVPRIRTASAVDVTQMFRYCNNVESGALALYSQMSSQATPPAEYSLCFQNCGSDTTTGSQELAQIPTSWGGTMA